MRIGILGGTFDPPHKGHLALAEAATSELRLDQLYFVPAFIPPMKENLLMTSAEHRLEMTKCLAAARSLFHVSDVEINRRGVSYTVDTLKEFRSKFPLPHELYFITGGDWGRNLNEWKEIETIFALASFVVASRPGFPTDLLRPEVRFLKFCPLDISSTEIRKQIREGKRNVEDVPENVLEYIIQHSLYQNE